MSQAQYKAAVRRLSQEWRALSEDDRAHFHAQANYQQSCRDELQNRPLMPKAQKGQGCAEPTTAALAAEEHCTKSLETLAGNSADTSSVVLLLGLNHCFCLAYRWAH